jgi:adenylate kinase family enzyme
LVIVGDSCSGKTTLGEELAERMFCPFIELDALYWKPGWTPSEIPPPLIAHRDAQMTRMGQCRGHRGR